MIHFVSRGTVCTLGGAKNVLSKSVTNALQNGTGRVGPFQVQAATLVATHGEKFPYAKPWPYKTTPFKIYHEPFDFTIDRMCENSKIITVDGNIGVGKDEFARRLAKEFDLAVMPSTPETNVFTLEPQNIDLRIFNELLPAYAQILDLKAFLQDPHPELGAVARLQMHWYHERWHDYRKALVHLLNTGQGVVLVRSAFSDMAFAEAFRSLGWMTKACMNFYHEMRTNTVCELPKPHIAIYLDAPIDVCQQRIAKKNDPRYANARNLTNEYLQAIDNAYKQKVLPALRKTTEVLEIDWAEVADDMDMDVIAEEISCLNLESEDNEDVKFGDWYKKNEEDLSVMRRQMTIENDWEELFNLPMPFDCPEFMMSDDMYDAYKQIVLSHPSVKYMPGWVPEMGDEVLFKI